MEKATEINQTLPTQNQPQASQLSTEINLNPCQGYLVDLETKLHLCQACPYHKYRNEIKPWMKKDKNQS